MRRLFLGGVLVILFIASRRAEEEHREAAGDAEPDAWWRRMVRGMALLGAVLVFEGLCWALAFAFF